MTYAEVVAELAQVDAAIQAITGTGTSDPGAQAYSSGGRNLTRANLDTLYKRKKELETLKTRLASTDGGSVRYPLFTTRS